MTSFLIPKTFEYHSNEPSDFGITFFLSSVKVATDSSSFKKRFFCIDECNFNSLFRQINFSWFQPISSTLYFQFDCCFFKKKLPHFYLFIYLHVNLFSSRSFIGTDDKCQSFSVQINITKKKKNYRSGWLLAQHIKSPFAKGCIWLSFNGWYILSDERNKQWLYFAMVWYFGIFWLLKMAFGRNKIKTNGYIDI